MPTDQTAARFWSLVLKGQGHGKVVFLNCKPVAGLLSEALVSSSAINNSIVILKIFIHAGGIIATEL